MNESRAIKSDETLLNIIDELQRRNGARICDVADTLDLANSTVHSHLATLEDRGYVMKIDRKYELSLKFYHIWNDIRNGDQIYVESENVVTKLAQETEERAYFIAFLDGKGIVVHKKKGVNGVIVPPDVGELVHLHTTSVGKAMLAEMDSTKVDRVISKWGLPAETTSSVTDERRLREEFEEIRQRGYAITKGERIEGLTSVAACVKRGSRVIGALSVSGPSERIERRYDLDHLGTTVIGAARELEMNASSK